MMSGPGSPRGGRAASFWSKHKEEEAMEAAASQPH